MQAELSLYTNVNDWKDLASNIVGYDFEYGKLSLSGELRGVDSKIEEERS